MLETQCKPADLLTPCSKKRTSGVWQYGRGREIGVTDRIHAWESCQHGQGYQDTSTNSLSAVSRARDLSCQIPFIGPVMKTSSATLAKAGNQSKTQSTSAVWRQAGPEDEAWITGLQELSFGPGRFARTAFRVRERFAIDPELSLIAQLDGKPVSSVLMTPISIGGVGGYMLGPLATDPAYRGRGAAQLLVKQACKMALEKRGAEFVLLIGDEAYYGPMGFEPATPNAIIFPGPVDPARVLVYAPNGDYAESLAGPIARFDAGK